jgi:hypothetical protein
MAKKSKGGAGYGTTTSAIRHLESAINAKPDPEFGLELVNRLVVEVREATR